MRAYGWVEQSALIASPDQGAVPGRSASIAGSKRTPPPPETWRQPEEAIVPPGASPRAKLSMMNAARSARDTSALP